MHSSNLVIVPNDDRPLEDKVKEVMGPSEEDGGGFWDWYQVGGRWTGLFDGYDPEKDPANQVQCWLCKGTGHRTDLPNQEHCNGCAGTGISTTWPTQWASHNGDVIPVKDLTEEQLIRCFRVVLPDGYGVQGGEKFIPWKEEDCFLQLPRPPLNWIKEQFKDYLAVIVDSHS